MAKLKSPPPVPVVVDRGWHPDRFEGVGPYQRKIRCPAPRKITLKEIAQEAALKGITPAELLLNAMREFNDEAEEAFACATEVADSDPKRAEELRKYGRTMISMACEVAKDAAPYVHSKLSSVTLAGDPNGAPVRIEMFGAQELKSMVRG